MEELTPGRPYVCKLLKQYDGKNHVEPQSNEFVTKNYTLDVTKCGEIFDLLVADDQINTIENTYYDGCETHIMTISRPLLGKMS